MGQGADLPPRLTPWAIVCRRSAAFLDLRGGVKLALMVRMGKAARRYGLHRPFSVDSGVSKESESVLGVKEKS